MSVGDVVNYKNGVGVVMQESPLSVAMNDGTTVTGNVDEFVLLMSRSRVLEIFMNSLGGNVCRPEV